MIKIIEGKTEKEKNDLHRVMLQCEKRNLHSRYIACISIAICVWLIVGDTSNNTEFVGQLSLAGTITSIILSVIAIIMSITGEGKTEAMRNQMLETTQELKHIVGSVDQIDKDVNTSIEKLKESIEILQDKIDRIPDATAEKFSMANIGRNIDLKEMHNTSTTWVR